ncbi:MAG: ATP synthase subunit I [Burkholderiales bacterium]|nr:ATP synthase subunit I [Pseudomonadota bacterium]
MKTICRIIALQIALTIFLALAWLVARDIPAAFSAVLGGAIGFFPGLVYALTILRARDSERPDRVLRAQYSGEFRKLLLTFAMFVAIFAWFKDVSVIALLSTYIATLVAYWAALLFPHEAS